MKISSRRGDTGTSRRFQLQLTETLVFFSFLRDVQDKNLLLTALISSLGVVSEPSRASHSASGLQPTWGQNRLSPDLLCDAQQAEARSSD